MKEKFFFTGYAPDCRKRHTHCRSKSVIEKFVVQLEVMIDNTWYPVIRYDTSHKMAHCDIIHWRGKTEKIIMPTLSYKIALSFADEDLNRNWQVYRDRFRQEVHRDQH